jgi:hypothetical protein
MSAPANILDLVQKLLRLADTSRGATEHEAESALAKAEELMIRHKIDSAMLRMSHGSEDLPGIAVQKEVINLPKTINPADMLILSLLQNHFNVRIVLFKHSHATPVDIIGTWEDVQFAIHVFHFLRKTFSRCWKEFKSAASFPDRKSYYRGLHDGHRSAILEGKKRAEAAASTQERSRYQIVLMNFQPSDVSFFAGFQTVLRATPFPSGVWRTCWLGKTNGDDAGRSAPACNLSDGLEVTVFPLNEDHVLFLLEIDGRYSWRKHFAGTQKCRNNRIGNSSRGVPLRGGGGLFSFAGHERGTFPVRQATRGAQGGFGRHADFRPGLPALI